MKLGIFGGSFDPIHIGHLLLAEYCCAQAQLDRVLFIPASQSPLKSHRPWATGKQRVEMILLALAGNEHFEVSDQELQRGGPSYTVETLEALHVQDEDELFLMMGADAIEEFSRWKEPARICQLATPLVFARRGHRADVGQLHPFVSAKKLGEIQEHQIEFPIIEISSTQIRSDIQRGFSIRYRLPRAVEKFIETHRLYLAR